MGKDKKKKEKKLKEKEKKMKKKKDNEQKQKIEPTNIETINDFQPTNVTESQSPFEQFMKKRTEEWHKPPEPANIHDPWAEAERVWEQNRQFWEEARRNWGGNDLSKDTQPEKTVRKSIEPEIIQKAKEKIKSRRESQIRREEPIQRRDKRVPIEERETPVKDVQIQPKIKPPEKPRIITEEKTIHIKQPTKPLIEPVQPQPKQLNEEQPKTIKAKDPEIEELIKESSKIPWGNIQKAWESTKQAIKPVSIKKKPGQKFLLIKSWGYSLWKDVDHVVGQLLVAELTNRIPVVHWGMDSLYSISLSTNAFELFFEPVSEYSIADLIDEAFTYFPSVWNSKNLFVGDPDKLKWHERDLESMFKSNADVLVSDVYYHVSSILPWIKKGHPLYGKTTHQIYRYLFDKYIKIRQEIIREADQFIHSHPTFRDEKPILGVHVRGDGTVTEIGQIYDLNLNYHPVIWQFMHNFECRHLFLITDSENYVKQYEKLYGKYNTLIVSDSKKNLFRGRVHPNRSNFPNQRHKDIELIQDTFDIIKDTYLALQCDYFIGNGYSSLSNTVLRMKDWPEGSIKLLY